MSWTEDFIFKVFIGSRRELDLVILFKVSIESRRELDRGFYIQSFHRKQT